MRISKSLFVEFGRSPKAARFYVNDKQRYQTIRDDRYGDMDGAKIGASVEDALKALLRDRGLTISRPAGKYAQAWKPTQELIKADHIDVIEQGRFQTSELRCATDFLVRNEEGLFELWEVKAKNTVRNKNKQETLKSDLVDDLSFQAYVLQQTLGDKFSGTVKLVYLNKEYIRDGALDLEQLITIDDVSDELLDDEAILKTINTMQAHLGMSEERFNLQYPYTGGNYIEYFGQATPPESIRTGPIHMSKRRALYDAGITDILSITADHMPLLLKKDNTPSKGFRFVELYQSGQTSIDTDAIQQELKKLEYPLFFYDYETINNPIPLRDHTHSRQQLVVQYSIHKIDKNGTITHHEHIIQDKITDNRELVDRLVKDLEGGEHGTYIVRNQNFENQRNDEHGIMYPQHADVFKRVNKKTYDLMNIFKHLLYFDRRFEGSASIKKVLPVLSDISYDDLEIGDGLSASNDLFNIATGALEDQERDRIIDNLLTYCKQDTRAMVEIWKFLQEAIK